MHPRHLRWALGAVAACGLLASCSTPAPPHVAAPPSPAGTVGLFVKAWSQRDWAAMENLVDDPPATFVTTNSAVLSDLGATSETVSAGAVSTHGGAATAPVSEHLVAGDIGSVLLTGTIRLRLVAHRWLVVWGPTTIDQRLGSGDRFAVTVQWAPRASILDASGAPLASASPTVTIGVRGSFVKNATTLVAALVAAGATPAQASAAIAEAQANPTQFVPVFTVSEARYLELKPAIYPVPGTVFQANTATPVATALSAVVGSVGTPTKAQLKALGPPYGADSIVGTSGIEESEQDRLAGKPGATISIVGPTGAAVATVATFAAAPGEAVRTSINPSIEAAAEAAMSGQTLDASLVAVRASTGQVVAVVNSPALGSNNLALDGAQPPGSTFKVITSTALILKGLSPSSPATCPPAITVDGEILHNAEGDRGISNLLGAFTESCNTAFIGLTMANLDAASLHDAAALYDIGTTPQLGAPAYAGSVPVAQGQTDLAASAIGQAQIVLSPLNLAMVAAAVDTGTVRAPRLVAGAPDDTAPTHQLPGNIARDLQEMMASVVSSGTAAGTGLPPGTYAKTGTAEYGTGIPLPIVAWLMGYNGDIAFAMCVVNATAYGGPNDGPIVAKFLDALGTAA